MWRCGAGARAPAALGVLALLLLALLARRAPPAHRPRPRPLPLALAAQSPVEASSTAYGNRTRASSSPPDTTRTPAGTGGGGGGSLPGAEGSDPGDNVAFDFGANNVNEGVSKISEGVSKVSDVISKVSDSVSKVIDGKNKDAAVKVASSGAKASGSKGVLLTGDLMTEGHTRAHPELCPALGARVKVLILVTSAPSHFAPRQAIRLTWGHFAARADVALGFVLGEPPPPLRKQLDDEDALYGDLIEGKFVDAYTNLTLKTLSMLEWAATYCPRARALLKTDDDMFINVPLLTDFLQARAGVTNTIWGKVLHKALPKRTAKSKYYLSPAQFPAAVLPDFATGPAYLMTSDVVQKLLDAAPAEKYLCLEDVFITGVLAARCGVARRHAPQFHNKRAAPPAPAACALRRRVALHMVRYHEQFDLWRKLLDGQAKCA